MRVNPTLLLLIVLFVIPFATSDSDGSVALEMVCPTGSEGFSLIECDGSTTDLMGWTVSDGEGEISFTSPFPLGPGQQVNIISEAPEEWMQLESYTLYGESGVVNDGFALSDKGDELYLKDPDGNVIDSFCYGDSTDPNPFQKIPKCHVAKRNHAYGYPDETEEWILHVPGRTLYHFQRTYEDCEIVPFTFPESNGEEILAHIQDATESIDISIYTFDNKEVASALRYAMEKGVKVRMLIEGSPAGGVDSEEIRVLTSLHDSGAEIMVIGSRDSYKRYQYVHSKYAVIDDRVTIITSENWTDSAFKGNRGWGVCIRDDDCARYIGQIFDSDFIERGDLTEFGEKYPTSLPYALRPYVPEDVEFETYRASVSPVLSPDYSYKSLKNFIQSAKYRIYSQQLNVQFDWVDDTDNPVQWMRQLGSAGIDSRLLVDVTYDSPYDNDLEDGYGLFIEYRYDPDIQVRYYVPTISGLMHNKGVIVDDSVWIGSMNWTDNSIWSNRELSVIVHSKEVTDIYLGTFLQDWGMEFDGTIDITIDIPKAEYGEYVTLDASNSSVPFGCEFSWNLDDDEDSERTGQTIEWRFYEDTECTLTIVDMEGNVFERRFMVTLDTEETSDTTTYDEEYLLSGPMKYVPMVVFVIAILALRRLRARLI